jgi:glutamate N-acetyltransferase / amino-acid N-acetyltransferase
MAKHDLSPLAPGAFPNMPALPGASLSVGRTGMRYRDRDDLLLMMFKPGATAAGVLTRSTLPGWPVHWCRARLKSGRARAVVVNAGNANVFSGRAGKAFVEATAKAAAGRVGCSANEVLIASTGIIGQVPPQEPMLACLAGLDLNAAASWQAAATAIATTDTFPKGATAGAAIDGVAVRVNGIAKGSGMIAPDMATLLAFLATDAKLPAAVLRLLLREANEASFSRISVDGDTSTSDTCLLVATGQAGHRPVRRAGDPRLKDFRRALNAVMKDLAEQVARDGEGASKLITITVAGAANDAAARKIAQSIGNSPLVKTAVAGGDANWGRVIMAIGKSGQKASAEKLKIWLGDQLVAANGGVRSGYDEARATEHFRGRHILLRVDAGVGRGSAEVITCDLTHGYIDINASYRS